MTWFFPTNAMRVCFKSTPNTHFLLCLWLGILGLNTVLVNLVKEHSHLDR
jgi:hypothetical protein